MPFRPGRGKVLVCLDEQATKHASDVLDLEIPDYWREKQQRGTIVAVGRDVADHPVGHVCIFGKYNGWRVPDHIAEEYGGECWVMDGPCKDKMHGDIYLVEDRDGE